MDPYRPGPRAWAQGRAAPATSFVPQLPPSDFENENTRGAMHESDGIRTITICWPFVLIRGSMWSPFQPFDLEGHIAVWPKRTLAANRPARLNKVIHQTTLFGYGSEGNRIALSPSEAIEITNHFSPHGVMIARLANELHLAEAFAVFEGVFVVCLCCRNMTEFAEQLKTMPQGFGLTPELKMKLEYHYGPLIDTGLGHHVLNNTSGLGMTAPGSDLVVDAPSVSTRVRHIGTYMRIERSEGIVTIKPRRRIYASNQVLGEVNSVTVVVRPSRGSQPVGMIRLPPRRETSFHLRQLLHFVEPLMSEETVAPDQVSVADCIKSDMESGGRGHMRTDERQTSSSDDQNALSKQFGWETLSQSDEEAAHGDDGWVVVLNAPSSEQ